MIRISLVTLLFVSQISQLAYAGQTINTRETEGYFYADGKMKKYDPQFEITYYLEGDTVTRTRVYDFKKKKVIPDNTVYQIQKQLWSHPGNPDPLAQMSNKITPQPAVVRAIGQPGTDAIEVLVIGESFVQACKSTSDYFVISKSKILE